MIYDMVDSEEEEERGSEAAPWWDPAGWKKDPAAPGGWAWSCPTRGAAKAPGRPQTPRPSPGATRLWWQEEDWEEVESGEEEEEEETWEELTARWIKEFREKEEREEEKRDEDWQE